MIIALENTNILITLESEIKENEKWCNFVEFQNGDMILIEFFSSIIKF